MVLHGTADAIGAGLQAHLEAGANHVAVQVLTADGNNPLPAYQQLADAVLS